MSERPVAEEMRRIYLGLAAGFIVAALVLIAPILISLGVTIPLLIIVIVLALQALLLLVFQMNLVAAPRGLKVLTLITLFGVAWLMFQLSFGR